MQLGNGKRLSFRKRYAVVVLAVLAIALLIIVPWANQLAVPVRAQLPPKSWGQLEVFRPIIANNLTIKSALDAGMMREVNISSPEVDGIKWTVNGIMADRRGIAVLYTIENNTDRKMQLFGLSLKKTPESNIYRTGYSGFSTTNAQEVGSPGTTRMYEQIVWDKYQDELEEALNISLRLLPTPDDPALSSGELKPLNIQIPMDTNKDYIQGKRVDLKDSLSIAGQQINMENIYIGPTGIYMRERYGQENTMRIFSLLSPKLVIGNGEQQEELMWLYGSNIYHNNNMRPDDPIKFEVEGINALDNTKMELVINTETQQILKVPDSNLTISKRMENEEQGILVLDYFIPKEYKDSLNDRGFGLSDYFEDSSGSGHMMETIKDGYSGYKEFNESSKGTTITYLFNVGKEKLPQPLTFWFNSYPNVIKENSSIRIR